MNNKKHLLLILSIITVISLLLSELAPSILRRSFNNSKDIIKLEQKVNKELNTAKKLADSFIAIAEKKSTPLLFRSYLDSLKRIFDSRQISIFKFENDELVFWSDNYDVHFISSDTSRNHLYKIQNKWYIGDWQVKGHNSYLTLLFLKNDFQYQNNFLQNVCNPIFNELNSYNITSSPNENSLKLRIESDLTIGIDRAKQLQIKNELSIKSIFQWIAFIGFLWLIYAVFSIKFFQSKPLLRLILVPLFLMITRLISLYVDFPNHGYGSLFSPEIFANTSINPSLGDFLINSIIIFFVAIYIYRNIIAVPREYLLIQSILSGILIWGLFFITDSLFASLVTHSTINLETFRIFNLTFFSAIGYFAISLWIAISILFADLWFKCYSRILSKTQQLLYLAIGLVILGFTLIITDYAPSYLGAIFSLLAIMVTGFVRNRGLHYTSNWQLLFSIIIACYTVFLVTNNSYKKDIEVRKILAINLSNERDPVAEMLFQGLGNNMRTDTSMQKFIANIEKYDMEMYRYLQDRYFSSYFKKYDFQATVCFQGTEILSDDPDERADCKEFFDGIIYRIGMQIPSSSFYYINNQTGKIIYLGIIEYRIKDKIANLYIELESKLNRELVGYPELLIESKFKNKEIISSYSTAKYLDNQLIAQTGNYPYRLQNSFQIDTSQKFSSINQGGFNHLIYRSDTDNIVILSKPRENILNTTVSFTYAFSFFFLINFLLFKLSGIPMVKRSRQRSFRDRIKLAMILVIFTSLVLVASATIYYSISNFEKKNRESLNEKLLSVTVELERDISKELMHNRTYSNSLSSRLIKLSNVFYSDINIFDNKGRLFATSRPEIFERQLLGEKMDPVAWYEMNYQHNPKLIHKEKIGGMTYLSAYVPIIDDENKIIAYLNLPYFTRQSEFIRELYSIIVAIINIYAFLTLLTIAIAILISNQISKPLELIMTNLGKVDITRHNEPIKYDGTDELGQLVKEYNRMVFELAESADKLARSQRESAWREMAKQIAHEIKNPLTPIKLNLQHLVKAKREGVADWDARFDKFSTTLVDQITALSAIATEFSDFAKMPISNVSEVNLNAIIDEVVSLFAGYSNIKVSFQNTAGKVYVNADKEQLFRVFVNLMKNAIQAIDVRKRGEIDISMSISDGRCLIAIKDNGKGIAEELRGKMFSPNFTTKSGGMGLGLAIVKGIIESINGKIWYETETNIGTTFFVEIPTSKNN